VRWKQPADTKGEEERFVSATIERVLTDEQKAQFERDGYLIVRGLLSQEEATTIRDAFMKMNEEGPVPGLSEINPNYRPEDPLSFYPRMMHPHRHSELPVGDLAMRYMLDSRIQSVLEELFGEEAVAAQSMFYFKPPGARGQDLHQDNFYLRVSPGTCMAAWVAIDDVDKENGGMMVVPGSHVLDIVCPSKADTSVSFTIDHVDVPEGMHTADANMKAGDVLFFNGSVIHGSYPNTSTERFRRAFICHYLPRHSETVSGGYHPIYTFDQESVQIPHAQGGGVCGTPDFGDNPPAF
jgi:ectoine hydroxylase-related dioxygenase (phytanoyl-CoA dioxygenase family)